MKLSRTSLGMVVFGGILAVAAIASILNVQRGLEAQAEEDLRSVLDSWRAAPPPPPREIAMLSAYDVTSEYNVVEAGGPEQATSTFDAKDLGLQVQISIHTCRPQVIHHGDRAGEINLVDGSTEDLCTSGGVLSVIDTQRGEEFQIHFKLLGSPNGTLGWNARQLVSERDEGETWFATLETLRGTLSRCEDSSLPPTVRESEGVVQSHEAIPPHALLMSGDTQSMQRLLSFRNAFRRLYENPDAPQAQCVAWLLIDTLLESPEQRELSEEWQTQLEEAG